MDEDLPMITTVTQKNMVTIPAEVGRKLGIRPGWRLDWQPVEGRDEILVRVIPDRGERARRLVGAGRKFSPDRDSVAELVAERVAEGVRLDRPGRAEFAQPGVSTPGPGRRPSFWSPAGPTPSAGAANRQRHAA